MQPPTDTPASRSSSARVASGVLLAAALLWCVFWYIHARGYWEDDAWIHLEFARSLSQGLGFSFNGHVVAGETAPLWVLLLAAVHAVVAQWLAAGKLLSVLGAIFGLAGIYAFARWIARQMLPAGASQLFPAAMVLLIVACPYTCYWIFSGMEPIACAGLACWAVLAATRRQPATMASFLTGCLLAGLGPLLRPEMAFLAVLLALPLLGQWRSLRAKPAAKLACLVAGGILLAGPLLCWLLYSLHAFGHLLANTNAAKRAGPDESVLRRLASSYLFGLPVILLGAFAGCIHLLLHPARVARSLRNALSSSLAPPAQDAAISRAAPRTLPPAGWIFILWVAACTLFYIADHTYVQTRYILIAAPAISIVVLAIALQLWPRCARLVYTAALAWALIASVLVVLPLVRNKAADCAADRQLALYLRDRLPPDAPVAVYSIGQIAFESRHPIIDTGGITRPGAIPYLNLPLAAMAQWAHSQGARYYISSPPPEPGAVIVFTVNPPFVGWTLHRSHYAVAYPVSIWKLPATPASQAQSAIPSSRPSAPPIP